MKTTTERQRRRSALSPSRPQPRQSPNFRPDPKSQTTIQSRTRTRSQTTMNKSPPLDTICLDSSSEAGAAEPVYSPEPLHDPSPDPSPDPSSAPGSSPGLDVVDLTSDLAAVVDLTNETVLVLDEEQTQSYVVSSDEEEPAVTETTTTSPAAAPKRARSSGVHINCPVCMDSYFEIVDSGRLLVSTRCGHVFCSLCLRDSLNQSHSCPICRKKLPKGHYHPLHI
uniref:RING-type domain-containing protein n=1 Tax=Neogobius melanostomus TaxID=47308 RepID=A0A8C6WE48_9GOBI